MEFVKTSAAKAICDYCIMTTVPHIIQGVPNGKRDKKKEGMFVYTRLHAAGRGRGRCGQARAAAKAAWQLADGQGKPKHKELRGAGQSQSDAPPQCKERSRLHQQTAGYRWTRAGAGKTRPLHSYSLPSSLLLALWNTPSWLCVSSDSCSWRDCDGLQIATACYRPTG